MTVARTRPFSMTRRGFLAGTTASLGALTVPAWLQGCAGPAASSARATLPMGGSLDMTANYFERSFGVTPEMVRKTLAAAMSRGGDWADLFFQHRLSFYLSLEDDIVSQAQSSVSLGVGMRVVAGDQTGYAFTEDLRLESMVAAARTAASIASAGAQTPPVDLTPTALPAHYDTSYDWQQVPLGNPVALLERLNKAAKSADPLVKSARLAFSSDQNRILIVRSDGQTAFDSQPMTRLWLSVVMEKDGERQSNGHNLSARAGMDFYTEQRLDTLVDTALARTRVLFDAPEAPRGRAPRRPRRRLVGHPPARGHRARHGGRLQPQRDIDLRGPYRQEGRRAGSHHRGTVGCTPTPEAPSTSMTKATSPRRPASSRTASCEATCTTA